ncbi:hypothetical protein F5Y16DRAFT_393566 [Xylariaceae sp. FL0255]|nr:hypothetical protein F5Y16DRAFT_393566 [Xylariaceae sp. FL0255]
MPQDEYSFGQFVTQFDELRVRSGKNGSYADAAVFPEPNVLEETITNSAEGQPPQQSKKHEDNSIPLYEERRAGNETHIDVRLPSLYAAEWKGDHAKVHAEGHCECSVKFDNFQPISVEQQNHGKKVRSNGWSKKRNKKGKRRAYDHGQTRSQGLSYNDNMNTNTCENGFCQGQHWGPGPSTSMQNGHNEQSQFQFACTDRPNLVTEGAYRGDSGEYFPKGPSIGEGEYHFGGPNPGQAARPAFAHPQGSVVKNVLPKDYIPGNILDYQTEHHGAHDTMPIVRGYSCMEEPGFQENQSFEFPIPPGTPFCGLPLGAGPEFRPHAGSFDDCPLNRSPQDSIKELSEGDVDSDNESTVSTPPMSSSDKGHTSPVQNDIEPRSPSSV